MSQYLLLAAFLPYVFIVFICRHDFSRRKIVVEHVIIPRFIAVASRHRAVAEVNDFKWVISKSRCRAAPRRHQCVTFRQQAAAASRGQLVARRCRGQCHGRPGVERLRAGKSAAKSAVRCCCASRPPAMWRVTVVNTTVIMTGELPRRFCVAAYAAVSYR